MAKNKENYGELGSLEFKKNGLTLNGVFYEFAAYKASDLEAAELRMQEEKAKYGDFTKEARILTNKRRKVMSKIEANNKIANLIDKKKSPKDKDIDKSIELTENNLDLQDQLMDLIEEDEDFEQNNQSEMTKLKFAYKKTLGEVVETMMVGITAEEFAENMRGLDEVIASNLANVTNWCISGMTSEKIISKLRIILENQFNAMYDTKQFR